MTGHGEKFGRRKELAIAALLVAPTLAEAAHVCGVSERTLRRWLKDGTIARRYREERTRVLESTINLLRQKSVAAVETLAHVADDTKAPAGARVSAARSLIEMAIKGAEVQEQPTFSISAPSGKKTGTVEDDTPCKPEHWRNCGLRSPKPAPPLPLTATILESSIAIRLACRAFLWFRTCSTSCRRRTPSI